MLTVVLEHDSQNSVSPLRREEPTSARTKELLSTKATTALLSKKPRKGPLADLDNHKLHAEEVYDMIAISDNEDSPPPNPKENSQKPPAIVDDIAKESKSSATVDKDDAADEEDYTESTKDVAEASDDENDLSYDPKGKSPLNEEEDDDDELEEIAEDGDGVIGLDDYEDSVVPKTYGRHAKWCDNCGKGEDNKRNRKKAAPDADLDGDLGRLLNCITCSYAWHRPCVEGSNKSMLTKSQCQPCRKEKVCAICKEPPYPIDEDDQNGPVYPLFRCYRCTFLAHVECMMQVYKDDVDDSDRDVITSGPGSRSHFERMWHCVDCLIWNDSVESIITYRDAEVDEEQSDEVDETSPQREYYVKWAKWSYRHCAWVSERWLSNCKAEQSKYRVFWAKVEKEIAAAAEVGEEPVWPKSVEDALPPGVLEIEYIVDATYVDPDGEEEFSNVDAVTIKWKGLPFDKCYQDDIFPEDDPLYPVLQEKYQEYLRRNAIGDVDSRQPIEKPFQEHITQPSFIHGGELKKYQIDGLNWLIYKWHKQTPSILADDMGLGKTVQIVSMLACLHHEYRRFPFVIAAPSSTLGHWKAEFAKWAPELVLVHYTGDGKGREKLREMMIFGPDDEDRDPGKNVRFHVLLANYESLMRDSAFFKKIDFEVLICDEGHRLKNDAAKTFSAFRKNIRNKHRIILTGTPLQNNVRELFNLLGFLDPKKFKNPAEWEKQYDSDELTDEKVKEIHELLAPYFLRRTKDAADLGLPPKVEILLPVSLTSLQTELYKGVLAKNAQILKQIGISTSGRDNARVSSLQNVLMELRKICNHPYCLQDVEPEGLSTEETLKHMIAASGKLALLHKMLAKLNAQGHRILIFSQFKMNLDILDDYLIGAGYSFVRMDGETALNIRQSIIDRFNDRNQDCFIFLLTTRTGAEGINLTAADTIIIYDADWNPHRDLQAMARAHRIGQDKPLVVYRFFTRRCVEEKILEAGKKKLVLDHLIIEQMAKKDSSPEELSSIIRYGAKALFEEDEQAIDAQQVKYDDVEVDRLLDRSAIFAEKQKDAEDPALNTATAKLGTFAKLWINEKADAGADVDLADDGGVGATGENGAVEEDDAGAFWERLLAYNTGKASGIPQQEFHPNGRAKRKRRHVDYAESKRMNKRMFLGFDGDDTASPFDTEADAETAASLEEQEVPDEDPTLDPEFAPQAEEEDEDEDDLMEVSDAEMVLEELHSPVKKKRGRSRMSDAETVPPPAAPQRGRPAAVKTATERQLVPTVPVQQPRLQQQQAAPHNTAPSSAAPAAVPTVAADGTRITIREAYTATAIAPACWLCFQHDLHPIDRCGVRENVRYLREAMNQLVAAVHTPPILPDEVRNQFIAKMNIVAMFLKRQGRAPPFPIPAMQPVRRDVLQQQSQRPALPGPVSVGGPSAPLLPGAYPLPIQRAQLERQIERMELAQSSPQTPTAAALTGTQAFHAAVQRAESQRVMAGMTPVSGTPVIGTPIIPTHNTTSTGMKQATTKGGATAFAKYAGVKSEFKPNVAEAVGNLKPVSPISVKSVEESDTVGLPNRTTTEPPSPATPFLNPNTSTPQVQIPTSSSQATNYATVFPPSTTQPTESSSRPSKLMPTSISTATSGSITGYSSPNTVYTNASMNPGYQPPRNFTSIQVPATSYPPGYPFNSGINTQPKSYSDPHTMGLPYQFYQAVPTPMMMTSLNPVDMRCFMCGANSHATDNANCPLLRSDPEGYRAKLRALIRTGHISHWTLRKVQDLETLATTWVENLPAKKGQSNTALANVRLPLALDSAAPMGTATWASSTWFAPGQRHSYSDGFQPHPSTGQWVNVMPTVAAQGNFTSQQPRTHQQSRPMQINTNQQMPAPVTEQTQRLRQVQQNLQSLRSPQLQSQSQQHAPKQMNSPQIPMWNACFSVAPSTSNVLSNSLSTGAKASLYVPPSTTMTPTGNGIGAASRPHQQQQQQQPPSSGPRLPSQQ